MQNSKVWTSCITQNQKIFNTWTGKIISKFICKYPIWVCTSNWMFTSKNSMQKVNKIHRRTVDYSGTIFLYQLKKVFLLKNSNRNRIMYQIFSVLELQEILNFLFNMSVLVFVTLVFISLATVVWPTLNKVRNKQINRSH